MNHERPSAAFGRNQTKKTTDSTDDTARPPAATKEGVDHERRERHEINVHKITQGKCPPMLAVSNDAPGMTAFRILFFVSFAAFVVSPFFVEIKKSSRLAKKQTVSITDTAADLSVVQSVVLYFVAQRN